MQLADKLFAIGSLVAAIAGLTEISASHQRWLRHEKQNIATPLCMMFVKILRIPKFAAMAKTTVGNTFPLVSAVIALIIWMVAFAYTVLPAPAQHHSAAHKN